MDMTVAKGETWKIFGLNIIPADSIFSTIKEAIDSVIQQTFEDFELICVNDSSTDNSEEILIDYSKNCVTYHCENGAYKKINNCKENSLCLKYDCLKGAFIHEKFLVV